MIRRFIRSSLAYGVVDFFGRFLSFVTFPIFARIFDVAEFGTLALITTIAALTGLIGNPGLNNAVQRFYLEPRFADRERRELVTTGLVVLAVWGALATLALLLPILVLHERLRDAFGLPAGVLVLALLACVPGQVVLFAQDLLRLHTRPWAFGAISLARNLAWFFFALALIVGAGWRLDGYFLGQLLAVIAIAPLALWLVRRDLTARVDSKRARELVAFGYPFIFGGLAYWILQSLDLWMLKALGTEVDLGLYSVAARIATIVTFVNLALGQAWAPYALRAYAEDPDYKTMVARVFTLWLFALTCVGSVLALFSRELLQVITPAAYWPASRTASALVFGAVAAGTLQISVLALSIERKTGLIALCSWLAVPLSAAANSLLIPVLGVLGAGFANLLTYAALSASTLFFSQRVHALPLERRKLGLLVVVGALVLAASLELDGAAGTAAAIGIKVGIVLAVFAVGAFARIVTRSMVRNAFSVGDRGASPAG